MAGPPRKKREIQSVHVLLSILLLFLILFVPLAAREWFTLRNEGLHDVEWHSTSLAELLGRDLEDRFDLSTVLSGLDDQRAYADFDRHVRQKVGHLGLRDVKFYDRSGKVVYPAGVGSRTDRLSEASGVRPALEGRTVSKIIGKEEYLREYGKEIPSDLAEVYVPIRGPDRAVRFVMEAYYDFQPIVERTRRQFRNSAAVLAAVLAFILAASGYMYKSRLDLERKVETLESILPICGHCKKIRVSRAGEPNRWQNVEEYFRREGAVEFSHGVCPECMEAHYPEFAKDRKGT